MEAVIVIAKVIAGFLAVLLVMGAPFAILNFVLDRRQKRRIQVRFLALGIPVSAIETHKNHYGISFAYDGAEFYVRCVPGANGFKWIRDVPAFLVQSHDTVRSR